MFVSANPCQMFVSVNPCQMFVSANPCEMFVSVNPCEMFVSANPCEMFLFQAYTYRAYEPCTGCVNCDCGAASVDPQCDLRTGQCTCRPGVIGHKCDQCEDGFWNYGPHGCHSMKFLINCTSYNMHKS